MEITEIERRIDQLFPTEGMKEDLSMEDPAVAELISVIHGWWNDFPESLKNKIKTIEHNMGKGCCPFSLQVTPWFSDDDDIDELLGLD